VCPIPVVVRFHWTSHQEYYLATVTAPYDAATTLRTGFYNANASRLESISAVFFRAGSVDRADVDGYYTAATVPVQINEIKTDFAVNTTNPFYGDAIVDLSYQGTDVTIVANRTAVAGEPFTLDAVHQGDTSVPPFEYRWYQDEQPLGKGPMGSRLTVVLTDIGTTVAFKVEVTDANGLKTIAKRTVDVVETCTSPSCETQY
jgi:hypothetical protein